MSGIYRNRFLHLKILWNVRKNKFLDEVEKINNDKNNLLYDLVTTSCSHKL